MPQGVVIIGVQWGDEGKGKIVDVYSASADVVARFQGGNNAGHTLVVDGKRTVLHLIPSGVLHEHSSCVIGSGVVVDPENFMEEIHTLKKLGHKQLEQRILLSGRCHLIFEYHKKLDEAREAKRLGKIGTTKRGIGPAYEDRAARRGIRVCDLFKPDTFATNLRHNLEEKNALLHHLYNTEGFDINKTIEKYQAFAEQLRPFVRDTSAFLWDQIHAGKKIVYEGAQGVLLDIDYGTYPYVTSSHTIPGQAALGLGNRIPKDTLFIGVMKAYTTRVGEGPFPTEITDSFGDKLRESGGEFGATTGRPRRCGWLDLVAVKYALRVSGITHLAITKTDVLSGIGPLKICTGYQLEGKSLATLPADTSLLERVTPVYETLPGWDEDLAGKTSTGELPGNLLNYINFIEDFTKAKVSIVSTGAGREDAIEIDHAF